MLAKSTTLRLLGCLALACAVSARPDASGHQFPEENPNNFYTLPGYDPSFDTLYPGNTGYNPRFPPFNMAPPESAAEARMLDAREEQEVAYDEGEYAYDWPAPPADDLDDVHLGTYTKPPKKDDDSSSSSSKRRVSQPPAPPKIHCRAIPNFGNPAVLLHSFLDNLNIHLGQTKYKWSVVYQAASRKIFRIVFAMKFSASNTQFFGLSFNSKTNQVLSFGLAGDFKQVAALIGLKNAQPVDNIVCGNLPCVFSGKCQPDEGCEPAVGATN